MCFLWKAICTAVVTCMCAANAPAGSTKHTRSFRWYSILYQNKREEMKCALQLAALTHVYHVTVMTALDGLVCAACLCHDGRTRSKHARARSSNTSRTIAPVRSACARGSALVSQLCIPSWQGGRRATSTLSNETCKQHVGGTSKSNSPVRTQGSENRCGELLHLSECPQSAPPNSILTHMVSGFAQACTVPLLM